MAHSNLFRASGVTKKGLGSAKLSVLKRLGLQRDARTQRARAWEPRGSAWGIERGRMRSARTRLLLRWLHASPPARSGLRQGRRCPHCGHPCRAGSRARPRSRHHARGCALEDEASAGDLCMCAACSIRLHADAERKVQVGVADACPGAARRSKYSSSRMGWEAMNLLAHMT